MNYIKNNYNAFVVKSRNQAIKIARGKIIFSIDDDSFPSIHSLKIAHSIFEKYKDVAIISCGIKNYYTYKNQILKKEDIKKIKDFTQTFTWSGCGGFIRKKFYNKYGPWDENGINCFYELLSCMWALKDKKKIINHENIYVFHKLSWGGKGGTIRSGNIMKNDEFYSNSFIILKYYEIFELIKKMSQLIYVISLASIEQKTLVYFKSYLRLVIDLRKILKQKKTFPKHVTKKVRLSFNFIGK